MLILEGPDCVGKTTIAREICSKHPSWAYRHMTRPPDGFDHFGGYLDQLQSRCVFDRFHLGALVYGNVATSQGQDTHMERLFAVARAIRFFGGITVVMYAGDDMWLGDKLSENGRHEMYSRNQIMLVNEVYRWLAKKEFVKNTRLVDVSHDVSKDGYPTIANASFWMELCR